MRGLLVAWGVGEAIIIYREVKKGKPPLPSLLLTTSGAYICLAVLAEFAPQLAITLGVGIDIAALFQVWPGSGGSSAAGAASLAADAAVAVA